jgi:hypothetical protein
VCKNNLTPPPISKSKKRDKNIAIYLKRGALIGLIFTLVNFLQTKNPLGLVDPTMGEASLKILAIFLNDIRTYIGLGLGIILGFFVYKSK